VTDSSDAREKRHPWFDELCALETEILDPSVRADPSRLDLLLADEFVEFGSSGRVYRKEMLIDMMTSESSAEVAMKDFEIRPLSPSAALVTYRSVGGAGREARRSSVWVMREGRWEMVFHQGTRITGAGRYFS